DTRFALGRAARRGFAPVPATEGKGDGFVRWTARGACPASGRIGRRSCEHWPRAARKVGQARGMRLYRGMTTRLYTHPIYLEHLTPAGHPERPDRIRAIEKILDEEAYHDLDRVQAPEGDEATILYAHPEEYVEKVRSLIPAEGIVKIDSDTTASPKSWQAAITAIGAANAAVDDVFAGTCKNVFVAARPPGHHAEKVTAMGFCLFNQAAIAARHAQRLHGAERVAIIDWDVHHGN